MDSKITKSKFYYDSTTGIIELHPFFDAVPEKDLPFFEETYDEWQKNLQAVSLGWSKKYSNGEVLDIITDPKIVKKQDNESEIINSQRYLSTTDYVITKLQEISLNGDLDELSQAKAQYSDVLAKRKEARTRIAELKAENEKL